ncbi:potassium channel family protein [Psychrobacter urativorans]|uniref:potassium channel family protein n=1 Tax=Psychrobacter urativorans TaxID=45610 RepID=UPI00191B0A71|nr:potassium channel family protein [Psychrobacter urativorans]
MEKITTARGLLFIFVCVGALWYALISFLPDNTWRAGFTIGMTFLFSGVFLWSLFSTLQRIYGDDGNLWKELAMTVLNAFLFLLTFAAVYQKIGIVDTTLDGNPITYDFWNCCYYSVITFTSTGYGDFRPQGIGRVLASVHSLIGYLVLGLLASTSMSVVKWTANNSGVDRGGKD